MPPEAPSTFPTHGTGAGEVVSGWFRLRLLMAVGAGWYALLCLVDFVRVRGATGGHFNFTQDDPYIHLALSEGIAHGHYGINAAEAASPSSSVLWPYLLSLFAHVRWQVMAVFGINLAMGVVAAVLLGALVAKWTRVERSHAEVTRRILSVMGLVFVANLVGLTFIGMEHTLQVMLTVAVAWGMVRALHGQSVPAWCMAAAVCGPLVRYEAVGLSLALAITLWGQRRRRAAGGLMLGSVVPVAAFSIYLHRLGLPWLPTSVINKGGLEFGNKISMRLNDAFGPLVQSRPETAEHWLLLVLVLTLAGLAWKARDRTQRFTLWAATIAAGGHMVVGRFGWNHRYEVYIVIFCVVLILDRMHEAPRMLLGWYVLGLGCCSALYIGAFLEVPQDAEDIYLQQYQMHRFVTEFYTGNVAVNDLGLVSYRRRPGTYVLDLGGLASVEVLRNNDGSAAWLGGIVKRHDVGLVMIYPDLFINIPADWRLLGEMCLERTPLRLGGRCVDFYATSLESAPALQNEFKAFTNTLPDGAEVDTSGSSGN